MNMRIGIIGTGHIGKTLSQKLAAAGHGVKVANSRGPETVHSEALSTGAQAVFATEAASNVDAIILSVPMESIPSLAPLVADVSDATLIIDTSNYYPTRDATIDAIEAGQVESLWVVEQLGHPIVKAWNAIGSESLAQKGKRAGAEGRITIPVAAEAHTDRVKTMQLVEDTGFDGFDAGTLEESWRQQPGAPVYCTDLTKEEFSDALASAEASRMPKRRDLAVAAIAERVGDGTTNPDSEWSVQLSRVLYM